MLLSAADITKPIDPITPNSIPNVSQDDIAKGLVAIVEHSAKSPNVSHHIHAPMLNRIGFNLLFLASSDWPWNITAETILGMHLLFYGKEQVRILGTKRVEELLREQSIKQGAIYDSPQSIQSIPSFIQTYSIQTDELLEPDLSKYKNFNEFFFRKLRPEARPIQNENDKAVIVSAADCRLTVYTSVDVAKAFWVKGQNFNIPNLLNLAPASPELDPYKDASLAIFRLAPADYHRFHCPIDCEVGDITNVPGYFYTVNPQAINEPGFDVLTANIRSILYLKHIPTGKSVAFVAVGALLVGSIQWTGGKQKATILKRGDELGYFAYGGSTIVIVFPSEIVEFDNDLVSNSQKAIETLVKVGYSIGKVVSQS